MTRKTFRLFSLALILPALVTLGACGNNDGSDDAGGGGGGQDAGPQDAGTDAGPDCSSQYMVDISGVAMVHPVTQAIDTTQTLANTSLVLAKASSILGGSSDYALKYADCTDAAMALSPESGNEVQAPFDFMQVNTAPLSLGLIGIIDDTPGGDDNFVTTATGLASPPVHDNLTDLSAFAVDKDTEAALATLLGLNAGELVQKGFILGTFLDDQGAPMEGVTVVDGSGNPISQASYPSADFSTLETGATSANGVFIVTDVALGEYTGSKDGYTFSSQQAATLQGNAFVMFLTGTPTS